jgi:starvation-inducible DNA-binding protein
MSTHTHDKESQAVRLLVPDGFSPEEVKNLSSVLNALLADAFALYLKTKNFHWHMSGQHFRDYHLLLDEQAAQIFEITDAIAERVRKVGGTTIRSIGHIVRLQRIHDNDEDFVGPTEMLRELHADNKSLVESLRAAHEVASKANDYATTSMIENWIDEAARRLGSCVHAPSMRSFLMGETEVHRGWKGLRCRIKLTPNYWPCSIAATT